MKSNIYTLFLALSANMRGQQTPPQQIDVPSEKSNALPHQSPALQQLALG
jgi:hypothetical protein